MLLQGGYRVGRGLWNWEECGGAFTQQTTMCNTAGSKYNFDIDGMSAAISRKCKRMTTGELALQMVCDVQCSMSHPLSGCHPLCPFRPHSTDEVISIAQGECSLDDTCRACSCVFRSS